MRLDETSSTIDANYEGTSNFRIESSTVTSFIYLEDLFNPSNNFVRRWIGWFVQIDDTISRLLIIGI